MRSCFCPRGGRVGGKYKKGTRVKEASDTEDDG